jgi:hypothetical protein
MKNLLIHRNGKIILILQIYLNLELLIFSKIANYNFI